MTSIVSASDPRELQAVFRRAVAFHQEGNLLGARRAYEELLEAEPSHADALHLLGVVAAQTGDPRRAVDLIGKALELDPHNPAAHGNLGSVLHGLRRLDAALACYDRAIAINPHFAQALLLRGNLLHELGRLDAALESYERVIAIQPDSAPAHSNRGNVLRELDRYDSALASYDRAIALDPRYAPAHFNQGVALNQLKQPAAALASYDRAIAIEPDFAEAHFNKSLMLLLMGDFARGWAEHEWRWKNRFGSNIHERRDFKEPTWRGEEPLEAKSILLYGEQGFGDALQLCRYVKLVADRGARVILEVQRPLERLLRGLDGVSRVVARGEPLPAFDYQCPLMSLPLAFETRLDTIPSPGRYIHSDPARVARWEARLGRRCEPRVGLMWNGNPIQPNDRNRSVWLADWVPYLPGGFRYVSLQRELREPDAATLGRHRHILNVADELHDFSDTAALCECLDLVISVCTSVAHLSGAMGRRTWIMLAHAADWRWLLDRDDSPWYPTARLYRQPRRGDWSSVFERVRRDLLEAFPSSTPRV